MVIIRLVFIISLEFTMFYTLNKRTVNIGSINIKLFSQLLKKLFILLFNLYTKKSYYDTKLLKVFFMVKKSYI
jgi:hypothetical protein